MKRLVRTITPDPNAPAVDIELRIEVRGACRLPLGLHPTFRLPTEAGAARIEPAAFAEGRTYPGTVEPSAPLFAIDRAFSSLNAVPGRDGGSIDASRLPFARDTEELLQLNGIDGSVALANEADGYRVRLTWQKEHFPSLLLWISNRGRKDAALERSPSRARHGADLLALRPRSRPSPAPITRWRKPARPRLGISPPAKSSPPAIASKPKQL